MEGRLRVAVIGCGTRGQIYAGLAARQPGRFAIVAGADPVLERRERIAEVSGDPCFRRFTSAEALFAEERLADVAIVATQDADHFRSCTAALRRGYDVLLEKPIATEPREVLEIERLAEELGRRVSLCYVLRFTPFYRKVRELVKSGAIGELVSIDASEGVQPWRQAHAYVRGHWAVVEKSTPMILSKCSHDLDIFSWLIERDCERVSSFGSLEYFTAANAPAGAPERCHQGCPVAGSCEFDAALYLGKHREPWLGYIFDGDDQANEEKIRSWLGASPWGRCVWRCDNTAVDRQVVAMQFAGGVTGTLTMTAFDVGRTITIRGTRAVLSGRLRERKCTTGDITITEHDTGEVTVCEIDRTALSGDRHGGGDAGLVLALFDELTTDEAQSTLRSAVQSHWMAFAAEESRLSGATVALAEFRERIRSG